MTTPTSSLGASRQLLRLPAGSVPGIVGFLIPVLLAVSSAQQAARSGEELYIDRLGCWNCHGQAGQGGGGAGPAIVKSRLPLRQFVRHVRLPSESMPPFAPILASDADLAIVYVWLEGIDAVETPPRITFSLKRATGLTADGQKKAETEVELTVLNGERNLGSDVPNATSLRYRVLLTQANTPVANHVVEYQLAGREGWSTFTTDEHGEALLAPDRGFTPGGARETKKPLATARLRMALAAGRYALVVEAIDDTEPAQPVVVGIGTAILNVE